MQTIRTLFSQIEEDQISTSGRAGVCRWTGQGGGTGGQGSGGWRRMLLARRRAQSCDGGTNSGGTPRPSSSPTSSDDTRRPCHTPPQLYTPYPRRQPGRPPHLYLRCHPYVYHCPSLYPRLQVPGGVPESLSASTSTNLIPNSKPDSLPSIQCLSQSESLSANIGDDTGSHHCPSLYPCLYYSSRGKARPLFQ